MTKMSKDKRDKLLLTIVCAVGAVACLYFLVITELKDRLVETGMRIEALRGKKENSERTLKRQADFQANLEKQRKILTMKQEQMPVPGADQRWFNKIIETRRSDYNLDLEEIRTAETGVDPGILPNFAFKGVAFTVVFTGAYTDFGRFVADFENDYPYMRVNTVSISPEARQAGGGAGTSHSPVTSDKEPTKLRFTFRVISLLKTPT